MPAKNENSRRPWKLGRLIGPKPPFNPKHIWAIGSRLQHEGRTRDLALFNTAIDSMPRGCDLGIEVDDALVMSEQTDICRSPRRPPRPPRPEAKLQALLCGCRSPCSDP